MLHIYNSTIHQIRPFSVFLMDMEGGKLPYSVINITSKFYMMEERSLIQIPKRKKSG